MERESFESDAIADILNSHFVSIKVDREERPDVDKTYMTFVQVRWTRPGRVESKCNRARCRRFRAVVAGRCPSS
jgi:hypothetical protein